MRNVLIDCGLDSEYGLFEIERFDGMVTGRYGNCYKFIINYRTDNKKSTLSLIIKDKKENEFEDATRWIRNIYDFVVNSINDGLLNLSRMKFNFNAWFDIDVKINNEV